MSRHRPHCMHNKVKPFSCNLQPKCESTQSTPNFLRLIVPTVCTGQSCCLATSPQGLPTTTVVWSIIPIIRKNLLSTNSSIFLAKKRPLRYSRSSWRKTHSHIFSPQSKKGPRSSTIVATAVAAAARSVLRKSKVKNKTIAKPTFIYQLSYFGYLLF